MPVDLALCKPSRGPVNPQGGEAGSFSEAPPLRKAPEGEPDVIADYPGLKVRRSVGSKSGMASL